MHLSQTSITASSCAFWIRSNTTQMFPVTTINNIRSLKGFPRMYGCSPLWRGYTAHQHIIRLDGFQSMQAWHSTHRHMHKYTHMYSRQTGTHAHTQYFYIMTLCTRASTQCTAVGSVMMYCSYNSEYHYRPNMTTYVRLFPGLSLTLKYTQTFCTNTRGRCVHTIANI